MSELQRLKRENAELRERLEAVKSYELGLQQTKLFWALPLPPAVVEVIKAAQIVVAASDSRDDAMANLRAALKGAENG